MYDLMPIKDTLSSHGYEYVSFLGSGSFSDVFLCKSTNYNHHFAIKRTFERQITKLEYDNLLSLNHPNILKLYDAFNDEISQYLVMEYCSNGTIYQKGRLSYDKFVCYAKQILDALAFCHSQKVAHHDIKPENILLDQNDHIKLADFGMARHFDINDDSIEKSGSLMLLPPEMFNKDKVDLFKADIYALGITFFYMATGSYPYQRIQLNDIKKSILNGGIFTQRFNIHPKIKQLIDNMLEKNTDERLSADNLLKLPIFLSKLSRRSMTLYQGPGFITQTSLNLNSSRALNLNQHPVIPADTLAYRIINIPKNQKTSRHLPSLNTF